MKSKLPKVRSQAKLKKDLDKVFSLYIRQKYAKDNGESRCYTCGRVAHYKDLQNGHFVSRAHLATRYSEDNCRPQCVGCNIFGNGKTAVFASKLDSELGEGTVARLYREAQKITKDFPYVEKIAYYKEKLKESND